MNAKESVDRLNPQKWAATSATERLSLLEQVRENMKTYADELAESDTRMKNGIMGEDLFNDSVSMVGTIVPVASTVTACIDLYESLVKGGMLKPISITKVKEGLYDVHVFPQQAKDKLMYADRKDFIRVKGEPKQINPLTKPAGIIAVLG